MHAIDYLLSPKSENRRTKIVFVSGDEGDDESLAHLCLSKWRGEFDQAEYPPQEVYNGFSFFPSSYVLTGLKVFNPKLIDEKYVFLSVDDEPSTKAFINRGDWLYLNSAPYNIGHAKIRFPRILETLLAQHLEEQFTEDEQEEWVYQAKKVIDYESIENWSDLFKEVDKLRILFMGTKDKPYDLLRERMKSGWDEFSLYDIARDVSRYLCVSSRDSEKKLASSLIMYADKFGGSPFTTLLRATQLVLGRSHKIDFDSKLITVSAYNYDKCLGLTLPEPMKSLRYLTILQNRLHETREILGMDARSFSLLELTRISKEFEG